MKFYLFNLKFYLKSKLSGFSFIILNVYPDCLAVFSIPSTEAFSWARLIIDEAIVITIWAKCVLSKSKLFKIKHKTFEF